MAQSLREMDINIHVEFDQSASDEDEKQDDTGDESEADWKAAMENPQFRDMWSLANEITHAAAQIVGTSGHEWIAIHKQVMAILESYKKHWTPPMPESPKEPDTQAERIAAWRKYSAEAQEALSQLPTDVPCQFQALSEIKSIGDRMYQVKQAALKAGGTVPSDESLLAVIERLSQHSAIADLLSMATLLDERNQPDQSCKVILSIMQKHGVSVNSLTELMTSGVEIEQRRAQLRALGCNAGSIADWEDRKWEFAEWSVKGGTALVDLE